MSWHRTTNRRTRNVRITRKGYAILAALDRGEYRCLTTAEAVKRGGRRGLRKIRMMRKAAR